MYERSQHKCRSKCNDTPQTVPNSHYDGTCTLPIALQFVPSPLSPVVLLIPLPVALLLSLSTLDPWAAQLPLTSLHQPLSTPQSQELSHVFSEPCTITITDYLTISCIAFIEEELFCSHNWPFKFNQWNTIPAPLRFSYLSVIVWPYHIAWIHFSNFVMAAWLMRKFFISFTSSSEPASNPLESWKMKRVLLRKINSFSMLCSPLWGQ